MTTLIPTSGLGGSRDSLNGPLEEEHASSNEALPNSGIVIVDLQDGSNIPVSSTKGTFEIGLSLMDTIVVEVHGKSDSDLCITLCRLILNDEGDWLKPTRDLPCLLNDAPVKRQTDISHGSLIKVGDRYMHYNNYNKQYHVIPENDNETPPKENEVPIPSNAPPPKPRRVSNQEEAFLQAELAKAKKMSRSRRSVIDKVPVTYYSILQPILGEEMLDHMDISQQRLQIANLAFSYVSRQLVLHTEADVSPQALDLIYRVLQEMSEDNEDVLLDFIVIYHQEGVNDGTVRQPAHKALILLLTHLLKFSLDPVEPNIVWLQVLNHIVVNHFDDVMEYMIEYQAGASVMGNMAAHASNATIQQYGCCVLAHLANYRQKPNERSPVREGGLDLIVQAIFNHSNDPIVVEPGCRALANVIGNLISTQEQGTQLSKREMRRTDTLWELLEQHALPIIMSVVQTFPENDDIIKNALYVLSHVDVRARSRSLNRADSTESEATLSRASSVQDTDVFSEEDRVKSPREGLLKSPSETALPTVKEASPEVVKKPEKYKESDIEEVLDVPNKEELKSSKAYYDQSENSVKPQDKDNAQKERRIGVTENVDRSHSDAIIDMNQTVDAQIYDNKQNNVSLDVSQANKATERPSWTGEHIPDVLTTLINKSVEDSITSTVSEYYKPLNKENTVEQSYDSTASGAYQFYDIEGLQRQLQKDMASDIELELSMAADSSVADDSDLSNYLNVSKPTKKDSFNDLLESNYGLEESGDISNLLEPSIDDFESLVLKNQESDEIWNKADVELTNYSDTSENTAGYHDGYKENKTDNTSVSPPNNNFENATFTLEDIAEEEMVENGDQDAEQTDQNGEDAFTADHNTVVETLTARHVLMGYIAELWSDGSCFQALKLFKMPMEQLCREVEMAEPPVFQPGDTLTTWDPILVASMLVSLAQRVDRRSIALEILNIVMRLLDAHPLADVVLSLQTTVTTLLWGELQQHIQCTTVVDKLHAKVEGILASEDEEFNDEERHGLTAILYATQKQ
ncbi:unnamed protein product [Owenia fusiformis]|uniref:Uncharacterized protein n=1 Tax=Owenia fusiformis TaxID=6347 RepID=A0A8J1T4H5_OWEFU|nr:unnamed protein product [Owenia fusiformis]